MESFRDFCVIPPDDVTMLDRLFKDELEARKLTRESGEASDIAERLVEFDDRAREPDIKADRFDSLLKEIGATGREDSSRCHIR